MKKAAAVMTNQGRPTCHAAIISRELGIPAIVGTVNGTMSIHSGQDVTVCCAEGEEGTVYAGILPFELKELALEDLPRTRTRILMNIGNPEDAFSLASIPNDGVGLARLEFIIANHIQAHPLALIRLDSLKDAEAKAKLQELTAAYEDKPGYFIAKLVSRL